MASSSRSLRCERGLSITYLMKYPNFSQEKQLWSQGFQFVVGLDESGRGCLAGPVVAAGVCIDNNLITYPIKSAKGGAKQFNEVKSFKIRDSKKISQKQREYFYKQLTNHPNIQWNVGVVDEKIIDKINILEATKLAMQKVINGFDIKPDFLILDGNFRIHPIKYQKGIILPEAKLFNKVNSKIKQKSIVAADEKVFSCAAASIIAKVYRDRIIKNLHKKYPQYGFNENKGYGTKLHFKNLKKFGPCRVHRKTFYPVTTLVKREFV